MTFQQKRKPAKNRQNPDVLTFENTTRITNYDSNFSWSCNVADAYNCQIASNGEIIVSGAINSGTQILIQVTTTRAGYTSKTTNLTAQSIGLGIDKQLIAIIDPVVTVTKDKIVITQGKYQLLVNGWQKYDAPPEAISYQLARNGVLVAEYISDTKVISPVLETGEFLKTIEYINSDGKFVIQGVNFSEYKYILKVNIVYNNSLLVKMYKIG